MFLILKIFTVLYAQKYRVVSQNSSSLKYDFKVKNLFNIVGPQGK